MTTEFAAKRAAFAALHERGCFVMPNPWDIGSARYLASLGFKALATTSAGFGFTRALPDSALSRDLVLDHAADLARAAAVPLNVDFQNGYAPTASGVAESVRLCVATGAAGLSIEDSTGDAAGGRPLFELPEAVDRLRAAREAIDACARERNGEGRVVLTARAECFLVGHPDPLRESVKRLRAYAEAGADVLFAPGVRAREQIREVVEASGPKPVNAIVTADIGLRVADLAELGVRRVSVGSALARTAWGAFMRAARTLAEEGSFAGLNGAAPMAELSALFAEGREG